MEASIRKRYLASRRRLILLDYDGTLVDFTARPEDSVPGTRVLETLETLARDPANTVVIISGRDLKTLDAWLGKLPIDFVAEHGFALKEKSGKWRFPVAIKAKAKNWKRIVYPSMHRASTKLPGSFVEEKSSSLVWHFRRMKQGDALEIERELRADLAPVISKHNLKIMNDYDNLEVMPAEVDKGEATKLWLNMKKWDFILAAGDDTTDEDIFAVMPDSAITVKVRPGESRAKYRLLDSTELLTLLSSFTDIAS